jgi:hypothetical protein
MGRMNADRDAWTAYAERHGLIAPDLVPAELARPAPTNKYHAEPIHVDGVRFASKKEAARFLELKLLQNVGAIDELECQPVFYLHVMEIWRSQVPIRITTIGKFTADFRYRDLQTGEIVVEDTKSEATKTEAYRLRKRLAECVHGIYVREV